MGDPLEVVGFVGCGGCPGGNIEYAPESMAKNGAEAIHLATGFVVGFPPCPWIDYFIKTIETKFGIPVVVGTHPIPEHYLQVHQELPSHETVMKREALLATPQIRRAYD
jgi:predicted metal-binding protein